MRVFVTGASGFVGSAIVQELLRAGHEVVGLARSETAAKALNWAGASVHRGELTDLESLKKGIAESDGVIHAGFIHDFSKFKESCEIDRRAIEAMGSVLAGTKRPLVITSGLALVKSSAERPALEKDIPPANGHNPRIATEEAARAAAERGTNVSIVRLPPSVHGIGDHGFVPLLIDLARRKGVAAYVGEGTNHWSAVHRLDAAVLYRLAFEKNAANACYHAVGDAGIEFREIAKVIGKRLNIPVQSKSGEEANAHFEWFKHFAEVDATSSSDETRKALNWKPTQIDLLKDIDRPEYFGT